MAQDRSRLCLRPARRGTRPTAVHRGRTRPAPSPFKRVTYTVGFSPEATVHLEDLRDYIAANASWAIADGYIEDILSMCMSLDVLPYRGAQRDDIRPGLRTLGFRRRAVIAFRISEKSRQVDILGVYYGGREVPMTLD
ncbi:type II toxin-antitoxin system RelE/ParE family toxin [Citricoccus zhacaiensis]